MRPEFTDPDFIEESEPELIHERMMENLPDDISDMPGDFAHDFTMPAAIEISQLIQFNLLRTLMIAFPEYAYDEWLDLHGAQVHVTRHPANSATGYVSVKGEAGIVIEQGTVFCVPAVDDMETIEFESTEAAELTNGEVLIPIIAVEAGADSNVMADTITILAVPRQGILSVTNPEPTTGGIEEEDDDAFYERIHAEHISAMSYAGNDSDYIRWAKEVNGVGDCIVLSGWNGPGTVKLILVDANGAAASKELSKAVYDHIVSPDDRSQRLLPTGCAALTVEAAEIHPITYTCTGIVLDEDVGLTIEEIAESFRKAVFGLYVEAKREGILRYNDVRPLLASIGGIEDFSDFLIDGMHDNVILSANEYADTADILFTQKEAAYD